MSASMSLVDIWLEVWVNVLSVIQWLRSYKFKNDYTGWEISSKQIDENGMGEEFYM